jgi:hypothetical protein
MRTQVQFAEFRSTLPNGARGAEFVHYFVSLTAAAAQSAPVAKGKEVEAEAGPQHRIRITLSSTKIASVEKGGLRALIVLFRHGVRACVRACCKLSVLFHAFMHGDLDAFACARTLQLTRIRIDRMRILMG